jgi:hypothetical protein
MPFSLWCGTTRLGEIHQRFVDDKGTLNGVLIPQVDRALLRSEWQVRLPAPFGSGVRRLDIPMDGLEIPPDSPSRPRSQSKVALKPATDEELAGLPPEEQLRVEQDGAPVELAVVGLFAHRTPAGMPLPPEASTFPDGAVQEDSLWLVVMGPVPGATES